MEVVSLWLCLVCPNLCIFMALVTSLFCITDGSTESTAEATKPAHPVTCGRKDRPCELYLC